MFRLRGMEREALLAQLGEAVSDDAGWPAAAPESLPTDPLAFWATSALPEALTGPLLAPSKPAALVRRLGPFPFWRGESPLLEVLEPVYAAMGESALKVLQGRSGEKT